MPACLRLACLTVPNNNTKMLPHRYTGLWERTGDNAVITIRPTVAQTLLRFKGVVQVQGREGGAGRRGGMDGKASLGKVVEEEGRVNQPEKWLHSLQCADIGVRGERGEGVERGSGIWVWNGARGIWVGPFSSPAHAAPLFPARRRAPTLIKLLGCTLRTETCPRSTTYSGREGMRGGGMG